MTKLFFVFSIIQEDYDHRSRKCMMPFIYDLFFHKAVTDSGSLFLYCLDLLLTDLIFFKYTSPTLSALCSKVKVM